MKNRSKQNQPIYNTIPSRRQQPYNNNLISESELISSINHNQKIDFTQKMHTIQKSHISKNFIDKSKPDKSVSHNNTYNNKIIGQQSFKIMDLNNQQSSSLGNTDSSHEEQGQQKIKQKRSVPQKANTSKIEKEDKKQHLQKAYRFFQNYYRKKLMPCYRAFDIDPFIKDPLKNQINKNKSKHNKQQIGSMEQFQQIIKLINMKMTPIIKGIQIWIDSIINNKYSILNDIIPQTRQKISDLINLRLRQFEALAFNSWSKLNSSSLDKSNLPRKDSDFMEHGLIVCIHQFLKFTSSQLGQDFMFIVQAIFIIFIDIVIAYYKENITNKILKLHDIYIFYQRLNLMIQKIQAYNFIFIDEYNLIQLLGWFNSWTMIKQYIINQFNLDYLVEYQDMMNQINQRYQTNIRKYSKYKKKTQQKWRKQKKITKQKKIIQKKMLEDIRNINNINFYQNQGYNIQQILKTKRKTSQIYQKQSSFDHEQIIQNIEKKNMQNSELNLNICKYKNVNKSQSHNQPLHYLNISNDHNIQKFIQRINQQTLCWNKRFQQYIYIVKSPQSFRQIYKQKVQGQIKQVQELLTINKINYSNPYVIIKKERKNKLTYLKSYDNYQSQEQIRSLVNDEVSKQNQQDQQQLFQ